MSDCPSMNRRPPAFTLLQLLVVMAILSVLAALLTVWLGRSRITRSSSNAGGALKQLVTYEAVWRSQDTDRNGLADYWTRDVAGFHCVHDVNGKAVMLIDLAFARADKAPAMAYRELGGVTSAKLGFFFRAMTKDQDGMPYLQAGLPTPKARNAPSGVCTNQNRFGFVNFPQVYNSNGILMFMVNEDGVVWQKDTGSAAPVLDRSTAAPPGSDSTWAQFGG